MKIDPESEPFKAFVKAYLGPTLEGVTINSVLTAGIVAGLEAYEATKAINASGLVERIAELEAENAFMRGAIVYKVEKEPTP